MEKKIRTELYKMSGIMLILIGLGIYAHDFVITGIKAKVALNLSIFALFGVAASLGFRHVFNLKNEVLALKALQADYDPRGRHRSNRVDMSKPARVFHQPELLGEGYRLITEELGKQGEQGELHISNATVQSLLHEVDLRINDRKSTLIYFSGLMVFLGLLGAFMGLMKTVHSVSDLIGSMDMSGSGGSDAFGKMIEGMKAPLSGMSVGFSSSLFGLMTSMVLGALERCMGSAMKSLRNEFEHWISKMAALEGGQGEASTNLADDRMLRRVLESGVGQLREMRELVVANAQMTSSEKKRLDSMQFAIQAMAQSMTRMTEQVANLADPRDALAPIAGALERLGAHQGEMLAQIGRLQGDAAADRENLRGLVNVLEATVDRLEAVDGPELHGQLDRLLSLQAQLADGVMRAPAGVVTPAGTGGGGSRGIAGWFGQWRANRRVLTALAEQKREMAGLAAEMRLALAGNRRTLRKAGRMLGRRLERMEQGRDRDRRQVEHLAFLSRQQREHLGQIRERLGHEQAAPKTPYVGGRALVRALRDRLQMEFEADRPLDAQEIAARMAAGGER